VTFIQNDMWFLALPPCLAQVPCGHGEHTVRWHAGTLELLAHPDPEAERVLAALGGEQAGCVRVAEIWDRHAEDLRVLQVGPRGPADKITVAWDQVPKPGDELRGGTQPRPAPPRVAAQPAPPRVAAQPAAPRPAAHPAAPQVAWGRLAGSGAPPPGLRRTQRQAVRPLSTGLERVRQDLQRSITDLVTLLALGPAMAFRLSGQVAAAHAARPSAQNRPALAAAMQGRLAPLAEQWLGIDPDQVMVLPHQGDDPGGVELAGQGADVRLRARLPAGWLASVWACGLGLVDRHLVLATVRPGWPDAQVLALPAPGKDPVLLDVHGTADDTGTPTWTSR
jgi:hypothetical protein